MAEAGEIIGLTQWLQTPAGRYLLEWEQRHLDAALSDVFGFHALQLGLPELDALRSNRMPHRWVATNDPQRREGIALHCDYDALPFDSASLDLVVLPHTLEIARDPHLTLREVERVLMPEKRVVIVGFNPWSLWGLRQKLGRLRRGRSNHLYLPSEGEFIGYRRLRDWLRLLSFEVEAGRFGCYRPPVVSEKWLERFDWMERSGDRWWPVFGAVYFVVAVKRVRGMRLVGMVRDRPAVKPTAPAVAVNSHRRREAVEEETR
jgi:SAM-dependent methyltransferase